MAAPVTTGTQTRPTYEQFAAIRRYQPTLSFSPDGSEIAYSTNISGQYNLWRQPSSGGYPRQVTLFDDRAVREIAWSPDGDTIFFVADIDGNEMYQIFRIPAAGGVPEQLTDAPAVQFYLADGPFSPDGTTIAFAGNDREPTNQDVQLLNLQTGETRRLTTEDGSFFAARWSPDGKWLTVMDFQTNTRTDVHLVDVATGERQLVTPRDGDVLNLAEAWAADSSGFYLLTDEDREFTGLAFYDLNSGQKRWVETPEWDVERVALSQDGHFLAWVVNENGYSRLHLRDLRTGDLVDLPALPIGVISAMTITADGAKIGLLFSDATRPNEVMIVDVTSGTINQITESALGGIDPAEMVHPELIHYPTHDGRDIPAWLYRPKGDGPFGVVLSIHGGPESQEQAAYNYSGLYQYWLSRGIGVLAPNVRGSTGYGKTYQRLIHRDWGGDELKDFEQAVAWLHALDWVDPQRIGVFGGSFGGFATLSCVSRLPDLWAAAVDIVGPSNLVTFSKAVPPTWRRIMNEWVGDPETEVDFLMSRSPITYVDQIRAPLFVIQGANDPRVVQSESDQIVERLRERGVDVRYDVYADEGHGFTRRRNEIKAIGDTARFMERYLG